MGLGTLLLNADEAAKNLRSKVDARPPSGASETGNDAPTTETTPTAAPLNLASDSNTALSPSAESDSSGMAFFQLQEDKNEARFVILWPALGCPEIVDPGNRYLEITFLSKTAEGNIDETEIRSVIRDILVLDWDEARRPYREDARSWNLLEMNRRNLSNLVKTSGGIQIGTKMSLAKYQSTIKNRPLQFGELFHTTAEIVPKAYRDAGFTSITTARLELKADVELQSGHMYTLFYGPENGVLRSILQNRVILEKPYDDVPLLQKDGGVFIGGHLSVYRWHHDAKQPSETDAPNYGDRNRENLVRLFHPFMMGRTREENGQQKPLEYLNVGHITDLHTSSLWDFFDAKIFPHYSGDRLEIIDNRDRDPRRDADDRFELIANRYNNPNLNVRNLTHLLNSRPNDQFVDLILQTGDLIDFNRGFNFKPSHHPDHDYVFNLNWIRYYELLLMDYEHPTYTSLGNHDWRLNPYPPRIKAEAEHIFLLLYLVLIMTGVGATCGSLAGPIIGALENGSAAERVGYFFLLALLVPFAASPVLFVFLLLLAGPGIGFDQTFDVLFSKMGLAILFGGGWLLGIVTIALILIIEAIRRLADTPDPINNAAKGALWGTVAGAILGAVIAIVGAFFAFAQRDYMTHITNLLGDDFKDLLDDKNVAYLNAFGTDGVLYMTERSFDWYALVINPFPDYAFRYGNMSFMVADWGGSEILIGDPPIADDSLTDRQWELLTNWVQLAVVHRENLRKGGVTASQKQVVPILGLHTPVFCPMLDRNLDELHRSEEDTDNDDLTRGTMDERRNALIERFFKLGQGSYPGTLEPISAISLTGHTHTYDIFRHESADKVKWYQLEHFTAGFADKGLHITTACAGPPADGKGPSDNEAEERQRAKPLLEGFDQRKDNTYDEGNVKTYYKSGDRVVRPGGCRVLTFNVNTGQLEKIEEISAVTAKWGDG